jgi:hypothetical protein
MPTLQDLLDKDLDLGSEKVASQNMPENSGDDEIEKLAAELGLCNPKSTPVQEKNDAVSGQSKEANMSLSSIYNQLFPGDADVISGLGKTASDDKGINKEAELKEELKGRAAYDAFTQAVDGHLFKIAEELTGNATISADVNPKEEVPQAMDSNKPANSEEAINTAPQVTDEVKAKNSEETVGHFEQTTPAGEGEVQSETKQAAVRKHLLLLALGR